MTNVTWTRKENRDFTFAIVNNHKVSVFLLTPTTYVLYVDGMRAEINGRRVGKTSNKKLLMQKGVEIASKLPKRATPYPQKLPQPTVTSTRATGIFLTKLVK